MNQQIESIIESILAQAPPPQPGLRLEYRSSPSVDWDLRIVSNRDDLLGGIRAWLPEHFPVRPVRTKGSSFYAAFDDDYLAGQIDRVVDGRQIPSLTSPFARQRAIVQFIDPNTTKALHLGHLYEAILGNALAALLEDRGADIRRYCFVSDMSRSVCEAMAGYEAFGGDSTPESSGEKSDQMVGRLYAQYAAHYYALHPEEAGDEDPVRRETGMVGDRADHFVRCYQAEDADTRRLWRKVRDWVLDGQLATLARLNIRLDTVQYGSETDSVIDDIIRRGVASGVLQREASGTILFHSGKEDYRVVVMTRPDGFPTEHARQMAQMMSVQGECRGLDRYYTFMGMEWKPAWMLYENILRGCGDSPYHDIVQPICHGMVMVDGSKMKSSQGAVVLADQFLDEVERSRGVRRLVEESDDAVAAASFADIIVKAFFLSRRIGKDLNFSWNQVLSASDNPGWDIASAWSRLNRVYPSPAGNADAARAIFFRAFDLQRVLNHAASELDLSTAVKFVQRFAQTIPAELDARPLALARTIMERGLGALGMAR
jgi:arginyl-tRNA synthetase